MWKTLLIVFCAIVTCHCQNQSLHYHKKKPHYYYHDPYSPLIYGGGVLYYMAFILIKIKFAFIVGTILTIFIVAGKLFAVIKYAEYMNKPTHHHETEKIYIPTPMHDDHGPPSYGPPMHSYSSPSYPSSYSNGITVDKLPPNAEIAGGGQYYDSPPPNAYGGNYGHGRGFSNSDSYYDLFISMLQKLNLTEIAFKTMKLNSTECRKKFVCKTDYNAKYSKILSTTLDWMRDEYYDKYRTNDTVESSSDCDRLYQSCGTDI